MGDGLEGATTVVIGACGGVGREVARTLAAAGATVAIADLNRAAVDELADELGGVGQAFDATDADAMARFAGAVHAADGPPAAVVNVLGLWHSGDYSALSDADWARVLGANLTAVFLSARCFLPAMQEAGAGSMVNFASTAGEYGSIRPAAHYAAAKGGVIALTKSLAREVAADGVRVNAVSPGPLHTDMLQRKDDAELADIAGRTLVGRLGTPRDMADAVLFLASSASAWVTGEVLRVNGGALL
jgi:NAD(P)-dependent dehydrogenase (short-subunit alcohol dehydrogenase family)